MEGRRRIRDRGRGARGAPPWAEIPADLGEKHRDETPRVRLRTAGAHPDQAGALTSQVSGPLTSFSRFPAERALAAVICSWTSCSKVGMATWRKSPIGSGKSGGVIRE